MLVGGKKKKKRKTLLIDVLTMMDKNKTEKNGYEHFSISNTLWSRQTLSREWGRWFKVQALCTDLEGEGGGEFKYLFTQ